jgi:hypothetical protein
MSLLQRWLFNDILSGHYIASGGRITNDELESIWKEADVP